VLTDHQTGFYILSELLFSCFGRSIRKPYLSKASYPVHPARRCDARFPTKPRRKYIRRPIYPDGRYLSSSQFVIIIVSYYFFRFNEAEPSVCYLPHNAASRIRNTPAQCDYVYEVYHKYFKKTTLLIILRLSPMSMEYNFANNSVSTLLQ